MIATNENVNTKIVDCSMLNRGEDSVSQVFAGNELYSQLGRGAIHTTRIPLRIPSIGIALRIEIIFFINILISLAGRD